MNKKMVKYLIAVIILIVLVYTLIFIFISRQNNIEFKIEKYTVSEAFNDGFFIKANVSDINIKKNLILVNNEYTIRDGFNASVDFAYPKIPVASTDIEINNVVLEKLSLLFKDAKKHGLNKFFLNSGYRSYQSQNKIYEDSEDKNFVQRPGASEHQTGLAADIAYSGIRGKDFDNSKPGKWLINNAYQYGFILRCPKNKEDITKISYESWHFRYIGEPHAYFCNINKICLEEYLDILAKEGGYTVTIDNIIYTVYYETEESGYLNIPKSEDFYVSMDNKGGYIITTKREM